MGCHLPGSQLGGSVGQGEVIVVLRNTSPEAGFSSGRRSRLKEPHPDCPILRGVILAFCQRDLTCLMAGNTIDDTMW